MKRFDGGLNLTYGTLGSFIKYPRSTSVPDARRRSIPASKARILSGRARHRPCDCQCLRAIAAGGFDGAWRRHPLVYLVEAADDICYSVVDLEDGWELNCVSFEQVERALAPIARHPEKYDGDAENAGPICGPSHGMPKSEDDRIGFLRGKAIGNLVKAAVDAFIEHEDALLSGTLEGDLLANTPLGKDARQCKMLAVERIYNAPHVLPIEMAGFEVINGLLDSFVRAAIDIEEHKTHGKRRRRRPTGSTNFCRASCRKPMGFMPGSCG